MKPWPKVRLGEVLTADILKKEQRIAEIMGIIQKPLAKHRK